MSSFHVHVYHAVHFQTLHPEDLHKKWGIKRNKLWKSCGNVGKEMHGFNYLHSIALLVFCLYDIFAYFADMFSTEIRHLSWNNFIKIGRWELNNKTCARHVIWDWCARCVPLSSFETLQNVLQTKLANVGTLSLHSKPWNKQKCESINTVNADHLPFSPFQESSQMKLFSYTNRPMKLFLEDSLTSLVTTDLENRVVINAIGIWKKNTV